MARRIRGNLVALLVVAASGLAAEVGLKDLFDATRGTFRLRSWAWEAWEGLDRPTRLRSKGIDPAAWADPPPDPPDPEAEKRRKEREERQQKLKDAGRLPRYPTDRYPGFRFAERLEKKQAAFERMVKPASESTLEGLVKQIKKIGKARDKLDKEIAGATSDYQQIDEQIQKSIEPYRRQYIKKHGKPPSTVPVQMVLKRDFDRKSKRLQQLLALRQSEEEFLEWLPGRIAELIAELGVEERVRPVAALGRGVVDRDWRYRLRCARILGRLGDPASVAAFARALESESDPLVLAELIRIRAARGGDGLMELLSRRLGDPHWPVRATVVRELGRLRTKRAVDLLVARMQEEDGRLLDDITDALRKLSGRNLVPEPAPWRIWWEKSRSTWKPPEELVAAENGSSPGKGKTEGKGEGFVYFYGIRSSSKRVIFCIDVSGSMLFPLDGENGTKPARIVTAKRELLQALAALPEDARFNVVVYDSGVKVWRKRMQTANRKGKVAARKFVEKLEPGGATNIYDALKTSMDLAASLEKRDGKVPEADTIFFLTDGQPTHGEITDPMRILEEITRRNKVLGLVIHCVGVSSEQNKAFLFNLARQNRGQYAGHR